MYNEPTLIDKVALVLGGSRGIGAAIVRRLAANGASVALTYANSAEKAAETARAAARRIDHWRTMTTTSPSRRVTVAATPSP